MEKHNNNQTIQNKNKNKIPRKKNIPKINKHNNIKSQIKCALCNKLGHAAQVCYTNLQHNNTHILTNNKAKSNNQQLAPFSHNEQQHKIIKHKNNSSNKFKDDLKTAISHFESNKDDYANCLLYPEIFMARIPFICPVPTALARANCIMSFTPTTAGSSWGCALVPELMFQANLPASYTNIFMYGEGTASSSTITLDQLITPSVLFPNVAFTSISTGRVVGASMSVVQTQRAIDRAGFGLTARVYGLTNSSAGGLYHLDKAVVNNSVYKESVNFSNLDEESLRMVYAPGDFSDLHMKSQHPISGEQTDYGTFPIIQTYAEGWTPAAGSMPTFTVTIDIVIEYVPTPTLYQMVERKPAIVNPTALSKAENKVSQVDTGIDNQSVQQYSQLAKTSRNGLMDMGMKIASNLRAPF